MAGEQTLTGEKAPFLGEKLVDTSHGVSLELLEKKGPKGESKVFVRGEFGHAAKPTANKRLYTHGLWESQIGRLTPHLEGRKMLGELDHPTDGRTSLQRASHVVTDLRLEGDIVVGEAEILDTTLGRDLKAMLKAGIPIGISSRGYGSTKNDGKGTEVVQEDYKLVTFDFVAEPADSTAYPNVFFEGVEIPMDIEEGVVPPEDFEMAKKFAAKVTQDDAAADGDTKAVREEFRAMLLDQLASLKQEAREEILKEMLADPELAGAKAALEAVKSILRPFVLPTDAEAVVQERDNEISRLKNRLAEHELSLKEKDEIIDTLAEAAKEAGYKFFLERQLSDVPDAAIVRQMVGDVTQYENTEEVASAVKSAADEISSRREVEKAERDRRESRERDLKTTNEELAEALEESLQANRHQQVLLYAERTLTNHPEAAKIRRVLENTELTSTDQVSEIVESFRPSERTPEDVVSVRDRIASMTQSGRNQLNEGESTRSMRRERTGNYNGLGVGLSDLKKLSGISGKRN